MFKLGIVGAGIIGRDHSEAILRNNDCELVAVCDTVLERAEEIAKDHKAQSFTDYKEMCEKTELDAVILNLPHFLHHDVTVYFLEKGINVLVEKPMAMSVEECDSMIAAAEKSGAKLAVGHVQRYYSAYGEIKKLVESGKLGKLKMITEVRNVNYLPGRPKWFLDKKLSGGGIVMNYGAHTIDKIMYVTGETVTEATAYLSNPLSDDNVEINAQVLLQFTGDLTATVTYCGCPDTRAYETVFYFTNGMAKAAGGSDFCLFENNQWVNYGGTTDLLYDQLVEFVKFLKGEDSNIVTPEYGREVISAIEKIYAK